MRQKTLSVYIDEACGCSITKPLAVGDCVMLVEKYNEETGKSFFKLVRGEGIGGNSDPSIKKYHGWRGTTNSVSTFAHGLRKIIKASNPIKVDDDFGYYQKVTVGKDLKPNEN